MNDIDKCKAIPDDDPIMTGVPLGTAKKMDGIVYIRQSEWAQFMRILWHEVSKKPCPY